MTITAAIVLFAVIWFFALFIALPIGEQSQSEAGEIVPGTPASAPVDAMLKKKLIWVTVITCISWVVVVGIILSGVITVEMVDIFGRMDAPAPDQ